MPWVGVCGKACGWWWHLVGCSWAGKPHSLSGEGQKGGGWHSGTSGSWHRLVSKKKTESKKGATFSMGDTRGHNMPQSTCQYYSYHVCIYSLSLAYKYLYICSAPTDSPLSFSLQVPVMGNLLKVLTCTDLDEEPNFFLDFESETVYLFVFKGKFKHFEPNANPPYLCSMCSWQQTREGFLY